MSAQSSNTMSRFYRRLLLSLGILAVLIGLYAAASVVVLSIAIAPRRVPLDETPITAGLPAEAVAFSSAGENLTLRGFLLGGVRPRVVILLHGLDSNCWRGFHKDLARDYLEHGYSVLLFNLRGHGDSDGDALGMGWSEQNDVKGAVSLLLDRGFKPGSIGIHGTSYGAATAIIAAAHIPEISAVVADSAFADFRELLASELAQRVGPAAVLQPGIVWAMKWRYGLDPAEITPLKAVRLIPPRPILVMHGEADSRIPASHTRRLVAAASNPANEVWYLPGADHTKAYRLQRDEFLKRVFAFFDRYLLVS